MIGLGLMSQFLTTIDYPRAWLVLRPLSARVSPSSRASVMPMWLAGDHFVLVEGALNNIRQLSFIDTGMAGALVYRSAFLDRGGRPLGNRL